MNICVTGGAGFIGSHLVDSLVSKKHSVSVIDNLSTGKKRNLNQDISFYKLDIQNNKELNKVFLQKKFDIVFHLAAHASVRESTEDPVNDARSNILGTINLLNLSKQHKIRRFIFSSTGGAIYGETKNRPTSETHQPELPLSPYGVAKLSCEKYIYYYSQTFGLKASILRYGNVYGPRQDPFGEAGVIAIFCEKILSDKTLTINGDGKQTRDYIYVGDVVNANLKSINDSTSLNTYNIGTSVETSVNKLVKILSKYSDKKVKVKHANRQAGDISDSSLNINKAKKDLSWTPKINLNEGLEETYNWFKSNYK